MFGGVLGAMHYFNRTHSLNYDPIETCMKCKKEVKLSKCHSYQNKWLCDNCFSTLGEDRL